MYMPTMLPAQRKIEDVELIVHNVSAIEQRYVPIILPYQNDGNFRVNVG